MLYTSFRVLLMAYSFMGILYMIETDSYEYIFFPTAIIIGGAFSFFDPSDKEFLRRNGIGENNCWLFPDYGYDMYGNINNSSHHRDADIPYAPRNCPNLDSSRYMPKNIAKTSYSDISRRCKRNFEIKINKDEESK